MKKTQNVKTFTELEKKLDCLFDYEADEKITAILNAYDNVDEKSSPAEIQKVWNLAKPVIDELKKEKKQPKTFDEKNSKTAVKSFKWLALNNYKPLNLANTDFEKVNKSDKVIFHFSEKVAKTLTEKATEFEMENHDIKYYTDFTFNDNIDICSVLSISQKNQEIKVKSDLHNIIYYIYLDNFKPFNKDGEIIKSRQCVIDCGIPFKVYQKA